MRSTLTLLLALFVSPAWAQLPALPSPPQVPSTYFISPASGGWYQGTANINRFGDRLFIGDAVNYNTDNSPCGSDWFALFQNTLLPTNGCGSYSGFSVLYVAGGGDTQNINSTGGITAAVQSKNSGAGAALLALMGFAVVNNSASVTNGWGLYSECHLLANAHSGSSCYGYELDVRNLLDPNAKLVDAFSQSIVAGVQSACGAGLDPSQTGFPCGAAFQVVANDKPWGAGLTIHNNALTAGVGGTMNAIQMATAHRIVWYSGGGAVAGSVYVGGGGNLNLESTGFLVFNGNNGATCAGPTTGLFSAIGGLVIHC